MRKGLRILSPSPHVRFSRLPGSEPVGDSCCRRIRGSNVRDISAHQRGVRIDLKGDGDQRKYKDDGQGSHGRIVARDWGQIGQASRRKAEVSLRNARPGLQEAPPCHRAVRPPMRVSVAGWRSTGNRRNASTARFPRGFAFRIRLPPCTTRARAKGK